MGFFRKQEEKLALRLLAWQYQRTNTPLPSTSKLQAQTSQLVDDAHRIARERGRNVISVLKDLVKDIRRS